MRIIKTKGSTLCGSLQKSEAMKEKKPTRRVRKRGIEGKKPQMAKRCENVNVINNQNEGTKPAGKIYEEKPLVLCFDCRYFP